MRISPFSFGAKVKLNCRAAEKLGIRLKISESSTGIYCSRFIPFTNQSRWEDHDQDLSTGKATSCLNSHLVGSCHLFLRAIKFILEDYLWNKNLLHLLMLPHERKRVETIMKWRSNRSQMSMRNPWYKITCHLP